MMPIRIDCSVGDGGGGVMRTALALSIMTRTPIHLVNVRKNSSEPGLGWPHIALINGCSSWAKAEVGYCNFGSNELVFLPGTPNDYGTTMIDLDAEGTVVDVDVRARKNFKAVTDTFSGQLSNRNGCGVKGHSVVTPMIPLVNAVSGLKLVHRFVLKGGTETPGAPFLDTYDRSTASKLRRMGIKIEINAVRRGCIGIGGGEVVVDIDATRATDLGPDPAVLPQGNPDISLVLYIYGSPEYFHSCQESVIEVVSPVLDRFTTPSEVSFVFTDYPVDRMHALLIIGDGMRRVDAAVCHEEFEGQTQPWKHPMFSSILAQRLNAALGWFAGNDPRILDQLLPVMKVLNPGMSINCKPSTGHLRGVLDVIVNQFGL